jgi:hypothetical protein
MGLIDALPWSDAAGDDGFRLFSDEQLALRWLRGEPL